MAGLSKGRSSHLGDLLLWKSCSGACVIDGSLLGSALDVEYTVEQVPHMEIVQIVLDKKLLHAADQAAKRTRQNRSSLVRDALREYLRQLELRASEERDRQGYLRHSPADAEAHRWEAEAAWPQE
jgi:Arc/MetJ-type ribon-helix-helix transcriptional regulator